jgi:hypothetical protein
MAGKQLGGIGERAELARFPIARLKLQPSRPLSMADWQRTALTRLPVPAMQRQWPTIFRRAVNGALHREAK